LAAPKNNTGTSHLYKRIVKAKRFIDDNFGSEIDLAWLAEEACFSPFHFHRIFKKIYRKTPHKYLTEKRIEKAQYLLANTTLSITEICAAVGFESLGSFSLLFSRHVGCPPVIFRDKLERQKQALAIEPLRAIPFCFIDKWQNTLQA